MSKELCMEFMRDMESRQVENVKRWFREDSVLWMPPGEPIHGDRRIAAMFRIIFRNYSEIHWRVTEINMVSPRRFIYLHDSWGTIGKNTPYKNHVCTIIEFDEKGLITYLSDYFKDTAIFNSEKIVIPQPLKNTLA